MRILFAAVFALLLTAHSYALDRRVAVVNRSHSTIVSIYGSNRDRSSWEEDVLGNGVLDSGEHVIINFNDGSGYCIFDFKAVADDGTEIVKNRVNVCRVESWTIYD